MSKEISSLCIFPGYQTTSQWTSYSDVILSCFLSLDRVVKYSAWRRSSERSGRGWEWIIWLAGWFGLLSTGVVHHRRSLPPPLRRRLTDGPISSVSFYIQYSTVCIHSYQGNIESKKTWLANTVEWKWRQSAVWAPYWDNLTFNIAYSLQQRRKWMTMIYATTAKILDILPLIRI